MPVGADRAVAIRSDTVRLRNPCGADRHAVTASRYLATLKVIDRSRYGRPPMPMPIP
jgi:hypothetical protein